MMKNTTKFHTLILGSMLAFAACNSSSTTSSTTDSVTTKMDTAVSKVEQGAKNAVNKVEDAFNGNQDSNFCVKAAIDNAMELKVLSAVENKATSKELKNHAKMMIADHKKLGAQVKAYAQKKNYTLPADDNGKADDALSSIDKNSAGKDWDKAATDKLVDAHQDAVSMFEKAQDNVKDTELKAIITSALPTLRSHLDMVKDLQSKMK